MQEEAKSSERSVVVTLDDVEMKYLSGHIIDGRNLFPAVGCLVSWTIILSYKFHVDCAEVGKCLLFIKHVFFNGVLQLKHKMYNVNAFLNNMNNKIDLTVK
jgi:hypothetical protein